MRQAYDVFEKLPNGSSLWHGCVIGRFQANRRMQELAEHSANEFFLNRRSEIGFSPEGSAPKREWPLAKIAKAG
jgi:hypothetical protein